MRSFEPHLYKLNPVKLLLKVFLEMLPEILDLSWTCPGRPGEILELQEEL